MHTFNQQSKKSKGETIKLTLSGSAKVIFPEKPMREINYLCTAISTVEWAGVLFFKIISGKIEDQNLQMEVVEIYPMDKGTTGATGFKITPDVGKRHVELMKEHKSLIKMGLIHSHHSMDAFFSGTDMDELNENSAHHNWYLSVVVNNMGKFVAKIGYRCEGTSTIEIGGHVKTSPIITTKDIFIHFDVDVEKTIIPENVDSSWMSKFQEINKPKAYEYAGGYYQSGGIKHYNQANSNKGTLFLDEHSFQEKALTQKETSLLIGDPEDLKYDQISNELRELALDYLIPVLKALKVPTTILPQKSPNLFVAALQGAAYTASYLPSMDIIDAFDTAVGNLFSRINFETFIEKAEKNINAYYFADVLICVFRKAAYSAYVGTNVSRAKIAYIIDHIIDIQIEMEDDMNNEILEHEINS